MRSDYAASVAKKATPHEIIKEARSDGYWAALRDIEVGDIICDAARIRRERAEPKFDEWWKNVDARLLNDYWYREQVVAQLDELRRLYLAGFTKNYLEALKDQEQEIDAQPTPSPIVTQQRTFQGATAT